MDETSDVQREDAAPRILRGWPWDLLACIGVLTLATDGVQSAQGSVEWAVEHDLRWLGWVIFGSAVVTAVGAVYLVGWVLSRLVLRVVSGRQLQEDS